MKKFLLFSFIFFLSAPINAVTLTYNLRVRRAFSADPIARSAQQKKPRFLLSGIPIYHSRTSQIVETVPVINVCENRYVVGSLFNLRYIPSKHWWFEGTTGLERDHGSFTGTQNFKSSRVGIDDIVLTGGGRTFPTENMQLIGYGLIGIPTTTSIDECDRFGPFVGSRIYNVGIGAEISYSFFSSIQRSLTASVQGRIIHGFERSWFPILPEDGQLQPGNVSDLLVAVQYREGFTLIEAGYNATVFSNQALITPAQTIRSDPFVRNSWYAIISRGSLKSFFQKPFIYGAGINISSSEKFDAKTATCWLYFTFVF